MISHPVKYYRLDCNHIRAVRGAPKEPGDMVYCVQCEDIQVVKNKTSYHV